MKRILVIEDEPEMRRNLSTILKLEKFDVLTAEDGRAGLDLALQSRPDLILCDVMMPELDGYGVLQGLRAESATVRVNIKDLAFSPATLRIKVGQTVEWVNADPLAHTVTADDKSWGSGFINSDLWIATIHGSLTGEKPGSGSASHHH